MNKARAMLDALMGPGRDAQIHDRGAAKEKFKDSNVCKSYLVGLCPLEPAFLGGKRNFRTCEKIHSESMRQLYETHQATTSPPRSQALKQEYESELFKELHYVVRECDGRISSERGRIRGDWARKKPPLPAAVINKLSQMKKESSALVAQAEALDDDKFQEKMQLTAKANELAKEAQTTEEAELKKAVEAVIPEEVCEICGTCYTGKTADAAHLQFKIHSAYEQIREKFEALKVRKDEQSKLPKEKMDEESRVPQNGRKSLEERQEDKGGSKDKDGDKGKEASRDKLRERERDRSRNRGKERRRSSDSDRSRGRDRGRGRDVCRARGSNRRRSSDSDRSRGRAKIRRRDSRDASRGRARDRRR